MREIIALTVCCVLVAVVCLGVAIWSLIGGEGLTLDTLLLLSVCLTLAAVFGFCAAWLARDAGLLDLLKTQRQTPAASANTQANEEKASDKR